MCRQKMSIQGQTRLTVSYYVRKRLVQGYGYGHQLGFDQLQGQSQDQGQNTILVSSIYKIFYMCRKYTCLVLSTHFLSTHQDICFPAYKHCFLANWLSVSSQLFNPFPLSPKVSILIFNQLQNKQQQFVITFLTWLRENANTNSSKNYHKII